MPAQKRQKKHAVLTVAALLLMAAGALLPPVWGLSAAGMRVLGVFAGVLLLWLTVGIDWPSILCIGALALVPGLSMGGLLAASFGSGTFAFLLFTFLCTHALAQTPFIRRCAVAFVTSRLARRGPWMLALLFFASVLLVGSVISPTVLFVVYLPILEEICAVLGLKKGDKYAAMLMMGLVVCCGISSGMTPIAHVFPLMALEYYTSFTGLAISHLAYMGFAVPVGLLCFAAAMGIFRLVLRPPTGQVRQGGVDELKTGLPPMGRDEGLVLGVFGLVVALWVLPDFLAAALPVFAGPAYKSLGTAFPPLVGVVLLSVLPRRQGNGPLLPFATAMAQGVPWGALVMAAGTLALGHALANPDVGLMAALGQAIGPLAAGMPPLAMVALFTGWAALQTNLSSNMVTVTVVTAVFLPIGLAAGKAVSTPAVAAIIGMMAAYAFAFPPAMPCVAIAGASGWTTARAMALYGGLIAVAAVILTVLLGYPLAAVLM